MGQDRPAWAAETTPTLRGLNVVGPPAGAPRALHVDPRRGTGVDRQLSREPGSIVGHSKRLSRRSVVSMAVWDELRAVLFELWNQEPGPLRQFPDPREEEGRPRPYQIAVAAWAVAVAEDLHRRFGDGVRLTVGRLPYPPGSEPDIPLTDLTGPPRGDPLDPGQAQVELDGPATVRSGQTLHHGLVVHNLSGQVLPVATNGAVTAVVVDPQTGQVAGGFAEAQVMPLIMFPVAPGATERIPLLIGTASFRPELGYTVRPGSWGIQVPLDLECNPHHRDARLTPVLPLTVTA
jgi:hypothetical protein